MKDLLSPIRQSFTLCKMISLPPFVVHGTHALETSEVLEYKKEYFNLLKWITDGKLDPQKAMKLNYMNNYLKKEEV